MRAFVMSLIALVAITAMAVVGLNMVPSSASQVFIEKPNVRL